MVAIGAKALSGVAAVLGVASVVCISSAVAGEMLQDLKVGHILGGTPAKMQWGDILGVPVAGSVMFSRCCCWTRLTLTDRRNRIW